MRPLAVLAFVAVAVSNDFALLAEEGIEDTSIVFLGVKNVSVDFGRSKSPVIDLGELSSRHWYDYELVFRNGALDTPPLKIVDAELSCGCMRFREPIHASSSASCVKIRIKPKAKHHRFVEYVSVKAEGGPNSFVTVHGLCP